MSRLSFHKTPLEGVLALDRKPIRDDRGFIERIFCQEELGASLAGKTIRQINRTLTRKKGTVRGMHFQYPPYAETKIVSCFRGKVLDIAIDLRKGSSTYLKHHSEILSVENLRSLLIPEGFAHGFQALSSDCELLYFHTADYNVEAEGGINSLDPTLNINWPLTVAERSERDCNLPPLATDFKGITLS